LHADAANDIVAEHLRNLSGERLALDVWYFNGGQDFRQLLGLEPDIHHRADYLFNCACSQCNLRLRWKVGMLESWKVGTPQNLQTF